jgi:hypothetical protein
MSKEIKKVSNNFEEILTVSPEIENPLFLLEQQKIALGEKFLSEDITQKTEISKQERLLLPLLYIIAHKPFPLSSKQCKKLQNYKINVLILYLEQYYKLGIPLNRKGRKEEVEVLKSLFGRDIIDGEEKIGLRDKILK